MTKKVLKDIIQEKINKNDIYKYVVNKKKWNYSGVVKLAILFVFCISIAVISFNKNMFKEKIHENAEHICINNVSEFGNKGTNVELVNIKETTNLYFSEDLEKTYPFMDRSANLYDNGSEILKQYETDIYFTIVENSDENPFNKIHNLVYVYKKIDGSGKIVISFDKNKKPIRDYFYETNSNKFSVIKNKNIIIYQYEDNYFTEFKDDDIYYDIESQNVSFEDFKYILDIVIE